MALTIDSKKQKVMECPVCFEWLQPPVITCKNGHGTCQKCRTSMGTCGICRPGFSKRNNVLLNEMFESVLVTCQNNLLGCEKLLPVKEMVDHKKVCFFRKVVCFVGACKKEIHLPDLNDHTTVNHSTSSYYHPVEFFSPVSICMIISDWLAKNACRRYFIVHITDTEINFAVRYIYKQDEDIFYVCVMFLGKNQEEAKNYVFDIKLSQKRNASIQDCSFTCKGQCIPYCSSFGNKEARRTDGSIPIKLKSIFFNYEYLKEFYFEIRIQKLE